MAHELPITISSLLMFAVSAEAQGISRASPDREIHEVLTRYAPDASIMDLFTDGHPMTFAYDSFPPPWLKQRDPETGLDPETNGGICQFLNNDPDPAP